jgi:inositol-pentakisphosphate 2-kinase
MAFSLSHTSPSQWKYISEGGATIVFSYCGPHHPILTGKVLRLRKAPREGHGYPHSTSDDNPDLTVAFQQNVISRLLDPCYLPDLQIIPLQADWVEALSIHHESFRPQERRSTSVIDSSRHTGVLAQDLIGGLSCAVEVKVNNLYLPDVPNDDFSKSQNGVSYLIATIYLQRASPSKLEPAGPACTLT